MAANKTELHDIVESLTEEQAAKVLPMLRDKGALLAAAERYALRDRARAAVEATQEKARSVGLDALGDSEIQAEVNAVRRRTGTT
jgi:hypothetical protein